MQPLDLESVERSIDRLSRQECLSAMEKARRLLDGIPDMPRPLRARWLHVLKRGEERLASIEAQTRRWRRPALR